MRARFDLDDPVLATIAWSQLAEPGDLVAGALVEHLGVSGALRWVADGGGANILRNNKRASETLNTAADYWCRRFAELDPATDLKAGQSIGATLLLPTNSNWPKGLKDIGNAAPFGLWVLGDFELAAKQNSVALVGSRAATAYGEHVTADIGAGLCDRNFVLVSGGAYGIDAAAHRAALASGGATLAFMAGGIDKLYPPGNMALLRAIIESGNGAVLAELPPGAVPFKSRFLARNRLIAAISKATVVVEAAWRSGALSTARHAAGLLRPVGAVPGPITSMASGGCHQLIRDGVAICVTDAAEIAELANPMGKSEPMDALVPQYPDLSFEARLVLESLSTRPKQFNTLLINSNLPLPNLLAALATLESRGLAKQSGTTWRRPKATPR